jgi:hypothetical protein
MAAFGRGPQGAPTTALPPAGLSGGTTAGTFSACSDRSPVQMRRHSPRPSFSSFHRNVARFRCVGPASTEVRQSEVDRNSRVGESPRERQEAAREAPGPCSGSATCCRPSHSGDLRVDGRVAIRSSCSRLGRAPASLEFGRAAIPRAPTRCRHAGDTRVAWASRRPAQRARGFVDWQVITDRVVFEHWAGRARACRERSTEIELTALPPETTLHLMTVSRLPKQRGTSS